MEDQPDLPPGKDQDEKGHFVLDNDPGLWDEPTDEPKKKAEPRYVKFEFSGVEVPQPPPLLFRVRVTKLFFIIP